MTRLANSYIVNLLALVIACAGCADFPPAPALPPPVGVDALWSVKGYYTPAAAAIDGPVAYVMTPSRKAAQVNVAFGNTQWTASTAVGDTTKFPAGPLFTTLGTLGCATADGVVLCNDDGFVALRETDGAFLWRTAAGACPSLCRIFGAHDSTAFWVSGPPDTLFVVDIRSGAQRWTGGGIPARRINSVSQDSGLTVIAGTDAITGYASVVALNSTTGSMIWSHVGGLAATGTALWQNLVLVSASTGKLYAFDRATGAVAWSLAGLDTTPRFFDRSISPCQSGPMDQPLIVVNDELFAATASGAIVMIDLPTHTVVHQTPAAFGPHLGYPLVADSSTLYVVNEAGALTEYSTADAHFLRVIQGKPDYVCGVALAGDRVIVTGFSGLYAIAK